MKRKFEVWQVKAIQGGSIILDQSAMTHFKGKGNIIEVPIWFLAATNGETNILVDTGIYDLKWVKEGPEPGCNQTPNQNTPDAVKLHMGWNPEEIDFVINTHLHYDHCGGNKYFPNATYVVQKTEWEAAHNPIKSESIFYNDDFFGKDAINYFQWDFVEGEIEYLPGIYLVPTPGHTRGHQSVMINTQEGILCVSGDVSNVLDNINENLEPNIIMDTKAYYESLVKIRQIAHRILPGHEPTIADGTTEGFPKILANN